MHPGVRHKLSLQLCCFSLPVMNAFLGLGLPIKLLSTDSSGRPSPDQKVEKKVGYHDYIVVTLILFVRTFHSDVSIHSSMGATRAHNRKDNQVN